MGKQSAPTPPDPQQTISEQTRSNIDTAVAQSNLNMVDQVTPTGNLTYTTSGTNADGTPHYVATTTLSPASQGLLDTTQQTQQTLLNRILDPTQQIAAPVYQQVGAASGDTSGIKFTVDNAGNIVRSFDGGPAIQRTYNNGGPLNEQIADAGAIQKSLGTDDFSADRQRVEDALFTRLNTELGNDRQALATRLANQGISVGSDAYTRAMSDFGSNVNDARTAAILNAGQEQNRLQQLALNAGNFANAAQGQQFGENTTAAQFAAAIQAQRNSQNAQAAQFANTAQQQQFGENQALAQFANDAQAQQYGQNANDTAVNNAAQQQRYNEQFQNSQSGVNATIANNAIQSQQLADAITLQNNPINQLNSLLSGTQIMPTFANTPQTGVAGTDVAGIVNNGYNGQVNAYNAGQQTLGGILGTGGTIAAGLIGLSDRRAKKDIERVGKTDQGLNVYRFRYKGQDGPKITGLMAQDVLKKKPEAVVRMGSLLGVNYTKALEAA